MVKVVVDFEYDAEQPDELSIRKGDIITNVKKQDGGWWEGTLNGKTGVFPDNFVKEIPDDAPKKSAIPTAPLPATAAVPSSTLPPAAASIDGKLDPKVSQTSADSRKGNINVKALAAGAQPPLLGRKPPSKSKRARVTFAYVPEQPDEVELRVGDILEIVKQEEEGWWEGIVNGKQGVFPSNFVEIIDDSTDNAEADMPSNSTEAATKRAPNSGGGMGYGDIFKGGQIQLKSARDNPTKTPASRDVPVAAAAVSGFYPGGSLPPASGAGAGGKGPTPAAQSQAPTAAAHTRSGSAGASLSEPAGAAKKKDKAKVLYAYQAENDDELNLDEGAIVTVLDQNLEDPGWWKGELNGKVGVFPDNFVELIPSDDTPPPRPMKPLPVAAAAKGELSSQSDLQRKDVADGRIFSTTAGSMQPPAVISTSSTAVAPPALPSKPSAQNNKAPAQVATSRSQESVTAKPAPPVAQLTPRLAPPEPKPVAAGLGGSPPPGVTPPPSAAAPAAVAAAAAAAAESSRVVDELRREVQELRAALQKQGDVERELKALREYVESTRKELGQRLNDVLREVDEEKKIRLATQVDMERIKKLTMAPAQR